MMRTSPEGLDLIKRHEGLRLEAYLDPVGVWTIGYGHTGSAYAKEGVKISRSKAAALLRQDLHEAEHAVAALVNVPLQQDEFDALVSIVFNVGAGAFNRSTLRRKLNAGDRAGAALEFGRWVFGTKDGKKIRLPGLVKRRAEEAAMFLADDDGSTSGVIGEAGAKDRQAPAAAALGGIAAVAAPVLQAAGSSAPSTILTVAGVLAAAFLIWKLTRD